MLATNALIINLLKLKSNFSESYRFILTGSSARKLKREGVNLLAGRAIRYTMHPLVAQELV